MLTTVSFKLFGNWRSRQRDLEVDFERFASAQEVTLTTNLLEKLASSCDHDVISKLVEVLRPYSQGWNVPPQGVAVTSRRLNFFGPGGKPLGNVGLSARLLTAHADGGFLQREAEPAVQNRCLELLEFADPLTTDAGKDC
jgi:hypothetical protein